MDSETRALTQQLQHAQCCPQLVLFKACTTSTNDDVRHYAEQGLQTVLVCSTQQTHGRGQRQRQWASPKGNIYLSTLVETNIAINGKLALEIGLNLLQIPALDNLALSLKWPNDLYSTQGKWGGILVEPISSTQAIVGIGINLMNHDALPQDQAITSLSMLGLDLGSCTSHAALDFIVEIYQAVLSAVQWFNYGSQNLAARFNHHAAFMQQAVSLETTEQRVEGIFQGIDAQGRLQILTVNGVEQFYHGRLRAQPTQEWA